MLGGGERRRHHLVAGQRAGLVGADHRDRAQRLDRRQAADDGVAPRHGLHADRQRDRQHRRQALGDRCDREADDRHEQLRERADARRSSRRPAALPATIRMNTVSQRAKMSIWRDKRRRQRLDIGRASR